MELIVYNITYWAKSELWVCDRAVPTAGFNSKSVTTTLRWRHNDHDVVSNHQPRGCLLNRLFTRRSKKTSKLRVIGPCAGNSPGTVNSPHKGPVTRKMLPFDDVIMTNQSGKRNSFWQLLWPGGRWICDLLWFLCRNGPLGNHIIDRTTAENKRHVPYIWKRQEKPSVSVAPWLTHMCPYPIAHNKSRTFEAQFTKLALFKLDSVPLYTKLTK